MATATMEPRTVLVADDDQDIRELISLRLAIEGFEVLEARSGFDALVILAKTIPVLAFFDVNMPGLDGYELTYLVRGDERLANLPIVMVSAAGGGEAIAAGAHCGANGYITKPFQFGSLMKVVDEYCAAA